MVDRACLEAFSFVSQRDPEAVAKHCLLPVHACLAALLVDAAPTGAEKAEGSSVVSAVSAEAGAALRTLVAMGQAHPCACTIRNARIKTVGKYQSCMVSKLQMVPMQHTSSGCSVHSLLTCAPSCYARPSGSQ